MQSGAGGDGRDEMTMLVRFDADATDEVCRQEIYRGVIHVRTAGSAAQAFVAHTRAMMREAFGGADPEFVQFEMPVEEYARVLSSLKPRFIHDPSSAEHLRAMLIEFGCDPELTYFDVPRLRTSTSGGYLTSGIAYAWHPHRDTWYSAPMSQINYWMPVFELVETNAMAFHPQYFASVLENDSAKYNYYEWNAKHRAAASANIGSESRPLPGPTQHVDLSSSLVLLPPVGATILFSAQHLHSSVPNTSGRTRISVDFRTVNVGDLRAGLGARNVDVHCTGTSIRDFHRVSDLAPIPDDVVALLADGTESLGDLTYAERTGSGPRPAGVSTEPSRQTLG
jgi:hypothetical protein